MKLPAKRSLRHRGKALELDSESETMKLIGQKGEPLGAVSWDAVMDFIQGYVEESRSHRAVRNFPRSRLAVKVSYLTPDNKQIKSITAEIGGGGVFIESNLPPRVGTDLALELVLPDDPTVPINAKGKVAWVRPREERYAFFPGMGVQFTEISEEGRARLLDMVKSLDQARKES